jgi:hypothetical protein
MRTFSLHHLLAYDPVLQALQEIVLRGADPANIRVVAVVAAPPALKLMADAYPGGFSCLLICLAAFLCPETACSISDCAAFALAAVKRH